MDHDDAQKFADRWAAAWNSHDVEAVLSHFADDAVFTSPVAAQLLAGSDGVIRGKAALRDYWLEGLRRIPDLKFEVLGVYAGLSTLVINYRNQRGGLVSEVLVFDGDLVTSGHGTYLGGGANPAGATAS
ncbi:MAG: nuclear transport factor 2 family protein [Actinomycetota bacterium]